MQSQFDRASPIGSQKATTESIWEHGSKINYLESAK